MDLEQLRFPIGEFNPPKKMSKEKISNWIKTIESFPNEIRNTVENLSDEQLDT